MSLDLLCVMAERSNYNRYSRFIKWESTPEEARTILQDLPHYFKVYGKRDEVDWEEFAEWFRVVKHPTFKPEKLKNFQILFDRLGTHSSTETAEEIVNKFILMDYCQQLADLSLRGAEGVDVDIDEFNTLLEKARDELGKAASLEEYIVPEDFTELLEDVVSGGLDWRMQFLNKSIGKLTKGKLVCFGARPNTGKTTWLASEVSYMASQLEEDECVLWFNNEEKGSQVKLRVAQAALGCDKSYIEDNPTKALAEYREAVNGENKIIMIDRADLNPVDIEEIVKQHKVKLIVVDQLWKVHGYERGAANDTARLGELYRWAREMAKKYAPFITVHQVKTDGEGVEYLTPSMLYLSGTVIQGEVDTLILMGRNYEAGQENNRYISIGKNKGAYGPQVDPDLQEGKASVIISPHTAEFIE